MSAFKNILTFSPKEYNYHIPNINTQLNHLFVLDTTSTYIFSPEEILHHIIIYYSCVLQSESWAQWIRNQIDDIEEEKIQDFMNQEYIKFYNICNTDTGFQGSYHTINGDIVDMIAENNQTTKPNANLSTSYDTDLETKK